MKQELRAGNNSGASAQLLRTGAGAKTCGGGSRASSFSTAGAASRMAPVRRVRRGPHVPALLACHLTYHSRQRAAHVPLLRLLRCPCRSVCPALRRAGSSSWAWAPSGLQEELQALYPGVEVMRMDADTITATQSHEVLCWTVSAGRTVPILLGDPDGGQGAGFRERHPGGGAWTPTSPSTSTTTGLRNGPSPCSPRWWAGPDEGTSRGRAVIQTLTPDNDIINLAARQDYDTFYEPGSGRCAACFAVSAVSEACSASDHLRAGGERRCSGPAPWLRRSLDPWIKPRQHGPEGPGGDPPWPGPGQPILKINNRYRYRVTGEMHAMTKEIRAILAQILRAAQQDRANKGLSILIDVDPMDG